MKKTSLWLAVTAAITLQTALQSNAVVAQQATSGIATESLLNQSDLVFAGKVVDIQFSNSTTGIPYTFVTYQVSDVIAGRPDGDLVTLRFIGGRQQKAEVTRYMTVSEMPEFRTGDADILFVKKNGSSICPLVNCTSGRFRNLDGVLANDDSFAVIKPAGETYTTSTQLIATAATTTDLLTNALSTPTADRLEPASPSLDLAIVKADQFVADLKAQAAKMPRFFDGSLRFSSVSIKQVFRSPSFQEVSVPATAGIAPVRAATTVPSDFDRWEESVVNKNAGNPVIQ